MYRYIYTRLRPLLILPLFILFSAGSYFSSKPAGEVGGPVKDSTAIFVGDGVNIMPGETLSCNSFKNLDVVVWLPEAVQSKYGKVKFYLYVDNKEFKTRDYTINDLQNQMMNQRSWKMIAVTEDKRKHSDFDNVNTEVLDKFRTCKLYADGSKAGYKLKIIAKGYRQTGMDKNGMPKFLKQEIFATSEIYVNTTGQSIGKK